MIAINNIGSALVTSVALGLALPATAFAQPEKVDRPYVAELQKCREIADSDARLACYDASVGDMLAATEAGDVQVVGKEEVEETRRGLFGFRMPKIGLLGGDKEEITLLQSTITKVRTIQRGYILTIEEGSVWQLNRVPARLRTPKIGDPVEFKKASLGTYFVRINGQIGVKGKRIE